MIRVSEPDEEFEALIEQSSLGSPAARRLRRRTPRAQAETVQLIARLRNLVYHGTGDQRRKAQQELAEVFRGLGYTERLTALQRAATGVTAAPEEIAGIEVITASPELLEMARQLLETDVKAADFTISPDHQMAIIANITAQGITASPTAESGLRDAAMEMLTVLRTQAAAEADRLPEPALVTEELDTIQSELERPARDNERLDRAVRRLVMLTETVSQLVAAAAELGALIRRR